MLSGEVPPPQREHVRYAHEAAVSFHVGDQVYEGRTKNLSRGGLCADLADRLPNGSDVDVSIVLVFADGVQSEALRLPARVAWCTDVDDAHQVGIAFRPLDAERTEYLSVFLRYLDDRRAEKAPRGLSVDDRFR
jgi:hypothetical protein